MSHDKDGALWFFADESGHSGANYLDPDQPYHVAGGFLIHEENLEAARDVIRYASRSSELKSSKLLNRKAGPRRAVELLTAVGKVATPVVSLIEKRFALGGRMADAFLDFAYNERAGIAFRADLELSRSVCDVFAQLSTPTLQLANAMMSNPSNASARACCIAVVNELRESGKLWLAHVMEGALAASDLSQAEEANVRSGLSANVPGLMNILAKLQGIGSFYDRRVIVIHDVQAEFEGPFRFFLQIVADPASQAHFQMLGNERVMPTLTHVERLDFSDSKTEVLLQAADLLIGSMRYLLRRLDHGRQWTESEAELAFLTLGGFAFEDVQEAAFHFFGSAELHTRLMHALTPHMLSLVRR